MNHATHAALQSLCGFAVLGAPLRKASHPSLKYAISLNAIPAPLGNKIVPRNRPTLARHKSQFYYFFAHRR
jgi:hypothetical protein